MDVFLQEHGKTIFIAVCILLLVGVAYVIGPIISNAVKYKKEDSIIRIWSHQDGKHSFLHILDNGMGIAKEDLPRVFEKSFTGKNGRIQQAST